MSDKKIRSSKLSTMLAPIQEADVVKSATGQARWRDVAGILAESLALHLANMALAWANSARRTRLGLPPA